MKAARSGPSSPRAWPQTSFPDARPACMMLVMRGSRSMTPRIFMTSATPEISGHDSNFAMASPSKSAPDISSPGAAGTQDGARTMTRSGKSRVASIAQRTPSSPRTLPNSCGSQTMVVTPRGTTVLAYIAGVTIELSMCIWLSIRPGLTKPPRALMILRASLRVAGSWTLAIIGPITPISALRISPVTISTNSPPVIRISKGASPRAAATARVRSLSLVRSAGSLVRLFIWLLPPLELKRSGRARGPYRQRQHIARFWPHWGGGQQWFGRVTGRSQVRLLYGHRQR